MPMWRAFPGWTFDEDEARHQSKVVILASLAPTTAEMLGLQEAVEVIRTGCQSRIQGA